MAAKKPTSAKGEEITQDAESVFLQQLQETGLTIKQLRFCQEYLVDYNATQAATRAGYSKDTAGSIGSENLKKPEIQSYINRLLEEQRLRTEITADKVLIELYKLGTADIRRIFTDSGQLASINSLPDDIAAAVTSVEVVTRNAGTNEDGTAEIEYVHKIRLADKKGALELLGKNLKLFSEKIEHEHAGKGGGPIQTENRSELDVARRLAFILEKASQ